MSPTRRDLLKASAGAVSLAIAGARLDQPVAAAKPEPLRPVSVRSVQVQVDMSDGRTAMLSTVRHRGEERDPVGVLTVGYIGDIASNEVHPIEDALARLFDWPNEVNVVMAMKDAGYDVERRTD